MLRRYLDRLAAEGGPRLDYGPFRAVFDLLTVQRKLKDAGRFVFIDRVRKNPDFLRSIPASLRYVREAFSRRPELAELQAILATPRPRAGAVADSASGPGESGRADALAAGLDARMCGSAAESERAPRSRGGSASVLAGGDAVPFKKRAAGPEARRPFNSVCREGYSAPTPR